MYVYFIESRFIVSYGGFENGAHHHLRLCEISPTEQDVVVEDVVEVVDSLAQLKAGRWIWRWPALFVLGVEAGGVRSEEMGHRDVHLSVTILHTVNAVNVRIWYIKTNSHTYIHTYIHMNIHT